MVLQRNAASVRSPETLGCALQQDDVCTLVDWIQRISGQGEMLEEGFIEAVGLQVNIINPLRGSPV